MSVQSARELSYTAFDGSPVLTYDVHSVVEVGVLISHGTKLMLIPWHQVRYLAFARNDHNVRNILDPHWKVDSL